MEKNEIMKESFYIKNIIAVIKGKFSNGQKTIEVINRRSDAFVYILSGSCTYRFDDGVAFTVQAGNVIYLPHQAIYTMDVYDSDYEFIFCDFEFSDQSAKKAAICSKKSTEHTDGLFAHLLNCYQTASISARANCMSILYHIYSLLLKNAEQEDHVENRDAHISAAKLYIDGHYSDVSISISEIAERSGISEVYCRKLFKEKYCISPSKYLVTTRLNNAKKLMQYAFLSIEDCALQSGFSSAQYFCRVFKKELGISPGEYRKSIYAKQ